MAKDGSEMQDEAKETVNSPRVRPRPALVSHGRLAVLLMAAIIIGGLVWRRTPDAPSGDSGNVLLQRAQAAYEVGAYRRVLEHVSRISESDESWVASRLIAGTAAEQLGELDAAVDYLTAYPRNGSEDSVQALFLLGEVFRQQGRVSEAEESYLLVLEIHSDHSRANAALGYLMSITARPWSARRCFERLLLTGTGTLKSLCLVTDPEQPVEHSDYLEYCLDQSPDDPLVLMGMADRARVLGDLGDAMQLARDSVAANPDLPDTHAFLGELLASSASPDMNAWHNHLPANSDDHVGLWFARGLVARRVGKLPVAARCFWETIRREPTHRRACHQLGQLLQPLNRSGADDFIKHAEALAAVSKSVSTIWSTDGENPDDMSLLIEQLEQIGRVQEAWAWASTAATLHSSRIEFSETARRLKSGPVSEFASNERSRESYNVALKYDLSEFPDSYDTARVDPDTVSNTNVSDHQPHSSSAIRFVERTDVGIDCAYFSAANPDVEGVRYFETTGGGVAVVDIDHDGKPDLYFTQGAEWPHGQNQPIPSDRLTDSLFRNRNARFENVGAVGNVDCRDYGQGCTVGDFNNDGFDDLYIANIGRNRLYCNQGDGTFVDVTESAELATFEWSASVVTVDLNADGNPDLFDVNYVTAADVYTRICEGGSCGPHAYQGVPDTLQLSNGDGTFTRVADVTPKSEAKGLGVVAAVIDDPQRPSLLIANDAVPNYLLKSVQADSPAGLRFDDNAVLAGVAANGDGAVTGSMGIAAEDVDQNGLIDFFVTNFVSESNSLYLQDVQGLFIDATYSARLHAPSLTKVAWGTQFLDADLDSDSDLVVVNGHVDDYQIDEQGYQMQPQFFRNSGRTEFDEIPPTDVGPWFSRRILGRGLARIDYNGDGRMDFVVSIIGESAALLENQSVDVGGYIAFELSATKTARDAIGTHVDVKTSDATWTKQLTAGDGYMASNQRLLQFGISDSDSVSEVVVRWPSGATTTITNIAVNSHVLVTEGIPTATVTSHTERYPFSIEAQLR